MHTLTRDKYWSTQELQELKRVLSLVSKSQIRNSLLIELGLYSGARESELTTIEFSDLYLDHSSVFIKHPLKGSSAREIPLPKEFFNRLHSYSKSITGPIFPISDSRIRQIWLEIRPLKKKFHSLRHTFGRQMYSVTKDILKVQYLLGHKSLNSTQIYTVVDYEAPKLRQAMGL